MTLPDILALSLIMFQFIDGYVTLMYLSIKVSGRVNFFLRTLIDILGKETAVILIKIIVITIIIYLYRIIPVWSLMIIILVYIGIILNKIRLIKIGYNNDSNLPSN